MAWELQAWPLHGPVAVPSPSLAPLGHIILLCQSYCYVFNQGEKKREKISISISWFPHSENEIFYEVLNLVVTVPLPVEASIKTRLCCHQHVLWAPSGQERGPSARPGKNSPCSALQMAPTVAVELQGGETGGLSAAVKGPRLRPCVTG